MKQLLFTLLIALTLVNANAQDYMDKIARQTCECSKNISDTVSKNRIYMELGSCMIVAAEPYRKQIKKDHNINLDNIETEGEALGKLIGIRMAGICPEILLKISGKETETDASESETFSGRVTKIEKDFFVIFTVNKDGKLMKFYWLTNVESNIELIDKYESLFDKDVKIKYQVTSLYDPKIKDYRNCNIIEKIEQLSR
jgi:hypothetical protein